ncbi:clathrin heavy-chain terminal domain-containing protein [Auricularia subglabra TFB-10046 SS5]|uniref:Clathrin heavy-chain terminal domain-containing protein n=1 Tax=Auricularia subglabra (strain TFB-10046 / SS5) TaxID=717982 RepID=J0D219_AURST|nr:clathrin heavy-chain terminal domain-containing protein [Auricularia subglabra TFB-10046 SS5]
MCALRDHKWCPQTRGPRVRASAGACPRVCGRVSAVGLGARARWSSHGLLTQHTGDDGANGTRPRACRAGRVKPGTHDHGLVHAIRRARDGGANAPSYATSVPVPPCTQRQLQVFNIELKQKVKSHMMNEDAVFWKWISTSTLGLVTETAVYHCSICDQTSPPQKIFDRHANLDGAQIINYRATEDDKWLVLVGTAGNTTNPAAFKVKGAMQLYSRERGVTQPIEGHAAAFATIKLDGHPHPTKLFTFSVQTAKGAKLHIVEIDHAEGNPAFQKKAVDVSQQHGIIYLVTKYSFIHLYDFETAARIYMGRVTSAPFSSHRALHRAPGDQRPAAYDCARDASPSRVHVSLHRPRAG